ncbi:hypothetical protein N7444_006238 [Penicillium canescens]|nr:hypothetical protein N7444_006238 [Penicillium canescens]
MILTHDDYTVAWICALPLEMAAAKSMLDEDHNNLFQHATDYNSYALGRLGIHNVAIACLPSGIYGTISAARVLSNMLSTFHSLKFGFTVGIGGGVPSESTDVRLGDVVVSNPHKAVGGVIQYDHGKACDGNFERIGSLNKPPQILLTSLSQIRSDYMLGKGLVQEIISNVLRKKTENEGRFFTPMPGFCDRNQLMDRAPRKKEPQIHYGVIASGNRVIKDAKQRDSIAQDSGILCFEMEAAGLMDQLPCLVIRGISDYCDSHKPQDWQRYAALSAASYTKELLGIVPSNTDRHVDTSMQWQKAPSQYSSAVTMTQKSAHHPSSTIHSGITINPKEITNYIGTPVASSEIPTFHETYYGYIHWAAIRGDYRKIQILLQSRADVTAVDGSGSTPLMLAASSGCSKSLKSLLDAGSNVHSKNSYGSDVLYHACRHQSELAPVIQLLRSGAYVNSQNKNGHTSLIGAAIRNNTKIGKYLHRKGATIDIRGQVAIFHNSHQFLRLLFHLSADYTLVSNSGSTILHSAALEGDFETLSILLHTDLGQLNISHRNKDHLTAAEMVQRRSIVPGGFELMAFELLSSVKAKTNPDQCFDI